MKSFAYLLPSGENAVYVDKKRYLWPLSTALPLLPMICAAAYLNTGAEWVLWIPLFFVYVMVPALDWLLGEDESNPPETLVPELESDPYYRVLTYIVVPLHYLSLVAGVWMAASHDLSWYSLLAVTLSTGLVSGLAINTGHELGHKNTPLETNLAKIVLAIPVYGHFTVEHNAGHHSQVATPEDCASARFGESIYRFALREIPGAFSRPWQLESRRLQRLGHSTWSWRNQILQSYALSVLLYGSLVVVFGLAMLPFMVIQAAFAWWQLTSANYIEHYGLLRTKKDNGQYERCQPHHSWNANHIFSNLILFHLERHSDHHAHANRRYQSLRHFENLPTLPSGYFGMYLLAYFPPLWRRVMDRRLLTQVGGDLSKVNIDPRAKTPVLRDSQPPQTESA
ncbi:MAG: alkane 1-monooxygenase [Gammaproteobacteria bacterium]|jgi:alkane 1-monooxygenase|nr:alkane 1-monooxygenase [Gammaproteobacteria bacterium]